MARPAYAGHAQLEAAYIEHVKGDVMTLARFAEQVGGGHLAVGEHQRAGAGAADAKLVLLSADGHPRSAAFDEKSGELLAVDLGKNRKEAGDAAVGNPLLFAVERVSAAVG